jgi:Protein of unknwon function (DUF3310)
MTKNDGMNLTPHEHTMLKFFRSDNFQNEFQKEASSGEIYPHVLAAIGDIIRPLNDIAAVVTKDASGMYKVKLSSGHICYYAPESKMLYALEGTFRYLTDKGVKASFLTPGLLESVSKKDTPAVKPNAISSQVGGDHYKNMKLQPWQVMRAVMTREEYTAYHIGTVMAYLMRHKAKGGEQDINKAQHHLTELVEYLNQEPA